MLPGDIGIPKYVLEYQMVLVGKVRVPTRSSRVLELIGPCLKSTLSASIKSFVDCLIDLCFTRSGE